MDGFGDNFDQPEVDPAAEFLAREHDQLAGLEDELNPVVPPPEDGMLYVCNLACLAFRCLYRYVNIRVSDMLNGASDFNRTWRLPNL
jgi:hypothetical protein